MKLTPLERKSPLKRGGRVNPRNAKRHKSEWARAYGSVERVQWVCSLGCVACGEGPSQNAHVISGGGSRKADARFIVPLCATCHRLQHGKGWGAVFVVGLGIPLTESLRIAFADQIQKEWERYAEED